MNALSEHNAQIIAKHKLDKVWQASTPKKYQLASLLGKGTFG